jgi:hypothetical protein
MHTGCLLLADIVWKSSKFPGDNFLAIRQSLVKPSPRVRVKEGTGKPVRKVNNVLLLSIAVIGARGWQAAASAAQEIDQHDAFPSRG